MAIRQWMTAAGAALALAGCVSDGDFTAQGIDPGTGKTRFMPMSADEARNTSVVVDGNLVPVADIAAHRNADDKQPCDTFVQREGGEFSVKTGLREIYNKEGTGLCKPVDRQAGAAVSAGSVADPSQPALPGGPLQLQPPQEPLRCTQALINGLWQKICVPATVAAN